MNPDVDKDSGADHTLLTKGRDPMLTELNPTPTPPVLDSILAPVSVSLMKTYSNFLEAYVSIGGDDPPLDFLVPTLYPP